MSWSLSQAHVQESLQEQLQEYGVAQYGMSVISELTQWSGSLTCLTSDLGQACQKYVCTIPFQAAYVNLTVTIVSQKYRELSLQVEISE